MSQGQKNSGRPCGRLMSLRHFQHVMLFSAPSERRALVQYVTNRLAVRRNIALLIERRHRGIQAVTMIVQSYAYVTWNHRSSKYILSLVEVTVSCIFLSPHTLFLCSLRFLEHLVSILMYPTLKLHRNHCASCMAEIFMAIETLAVHTSIPSLVQPISKAHADYLINCSTITAQTEGLHTFQPPTSYYNGMCRFSFGGNAKQGSNHHTQETVKRFI